MQDLRRAEAQSNALRLPRVMTPEPAPEDLAGVRAAVVLNRVRGSNIYAGTVPPEVVARRRAANKRARKARRHNR